MFGPYDISRLLLVLAALALLYAAAAWILWQWIRRIRDRYWLGLGADDPAPSDDGDDEPIDVPVEFVDVETAAETLAAARTPTADWSAPDWLDSAAQRRGPRARRARARRVRPAVPALIVLAVAALGIPVMGWMWYQAEWVEPYTLDVEKLRIPLAQMKGKAPIRIVQISDLHSDGVERIEQELPAAVQRLNPDVIVFTGDIGSASPRHRDQAIGGADAMAQAARTLQAVAKIRPQAAFACYGNHDISNVPPHTDILAHPTRLNGNAEDPLPPSRRLTVPMDNATAEWGYWRNIALRHIGADFRVLVGETMRYRSNTGVTIRFAGGGVYPYDPVGDEVERALEHLDATRGPNDITVLLGHYPSMVHGAVKHNVDVHLSGDTHNGQLVLPLLGPLIRKKIDGLFYENRLYKAKNAKTGHSTYMYVNRGLGMDRAVMPPWRFGCPPEITLIELVDPDYPEGSVTAAADLPTR